MPRRSEAEVVLAAVEDERHDQVLLVVEVAAEHAHEPVAGVGIGIAGKAQPVAVLRRDG